jgi:hypothetical protein
METASGVTAMLAAGPWVTVMVAASLLPSLVPVIVAEPAATAVTMPVASTVATPALLVVQMIARSVSGFCAASYATPVSGALVPATASTCDGRTTTLATGVLFTVIAAIPDFPFALAATCVEPTARAVTTPVVDTTAIAGSFTDHTTDASGRSLPVASCTCAWSGSCAPTAIVDEVGVTTTAATLSVDPGSVSVELLHDRVTSAAAPTSNQ